MRNDISPISQIGLIPGLNTVSAEIVITTVCFTVGKVTQCANFGNPSTNVIFYWSFKWKVLKTFFSFSENVIAQLF